jgi:hypothetical protein
MLIMNFLYYLIFSIHWVAYLTNFSNSFLCTLQRSLFKKHIQDTHICSLCFSTHIMQMFVCWPMEAGKFSMVTWSSPVHVHKFNNVRCETSKHFCNIGIYESQNQWNLKQTVRTSRFPVLLTDGTFTHQLLSVVDISKVKQTEICTKPLVHKARAVGQDGSQQNL